MAIADRILLYLKEHPYGVDDGEVARALGLKRRQQANAECKALAERGLISREHVKGQVRNLPLPEPKPAPGSEPPPDAAARWDRPWSWDGNVQAAVARHLEEAGFTVSAPPPGESAERTPDIQATSDERGALFVSVMGYPPETARSRAAQARTLFAEGLLNLVLWHGDSARPAVGLALPDFLAYRQLSEQARWAIEAMSATLFWVHADGRVIPAVHA